ncbi:MAG: nuclear transport factor 2 family protein [Sulfitobacter sp.]
MISPHDPTLLQDLITHERMVWDALVTGDAAADNQLLCDTFLGVYADGFAQKSDHSGQLDQGPTVQSYDLDRFHVKPLGADHALLSYRATFRRTARPKDEVMFVSSIWHRKKNGWINIFSQDTAQDSTTSS